MDPCSKNSSSSSVVSSRICLDRQERKFCWLSCFVSWRRGCLGDGWASWEYQLVSTNSVKFCSGWFFFPLSLFCAERASCTGDKSLQWGWQDEELQELCAGSHWCQVFTSMVTTDCSHAAVKLCYRKTTGWPLASWNDSVISTRTAQNFEVWRTFKHFSNICYNRVGQKQLSLLWRKECSHKVLRNVVSKGQAGGWSAHDAALFNKVTPCKL